MRVARIAFLGWMSVLVAVIAGLSPASNAKALRQHYAPPIAQWPAATIDPAVSFIEFSLSPAAPADESERQWAVLGARLFNDPILSHDGDIACASCHHPDHGWTIGRHAANGHRGKLGRRNPPSLYVTARQTHMGWTARETSLAQQSLLPLLRDDEMGNPSLDAVLERVRSNTGYISAFATLKGEASISSNDLVRALAAFQQRLDAPTRFDRFLDGDDTALSDQEIAGLHLFRTKARCANCHMGPALTDGRAHNLKISFFGEMSQDLGRYEDTGQPDDVGRFRTPSLRHVSKTAPYMHNGLFATLEGVINLYDRGGGEIWARNAAEAAHPLYPYAARLSPHIRPLELTSEEKAALLAFLNAL